MKKQKTVKLGVEDLEERIAPSLMLSTPGVEKFLALGGKAAMGVGHHHTGGFMHGNAPEAVDLGTDDGVDAGDGGDSGGDSGGDWIFDIAL